MAPFLIWISPKQVVFTSTYFFKLWFRLIPLFFYIICFIPLELSLSKNTIGVFIAIIMTVFVTQSSLIGPNNPAERQINHYPSIHLYRLENTVHWMSAVDKAAYYEGENHTHTYTNRLHWCLISDFMWLLLNACSDVQEGTDSKNVHQDQQHSPFITIVHMVKHVNLCIICRVGFPENPVLLM